MELAVIAPISRLIDTKDQQYHMVLPQLLGSHTYSHFYSHLPTEKYIILDNGEAEGECFKSKDLIKCAERINAKEIVVPDVMGDYIGTVERVVKFRRTAIRNQQYNYAGVVQGHDINEIAKCVRRYAISEWINVLALPRWLSNHVEQDMRITIMRGLAQAIKDGFEAVHCLGAGRWFREVVPLGEWPIRSIDTSLPHVMALADRSVVTGEYLSRQPQFFWADLNKFQQELALRNIHHYEAWCRGPEFKHQETRFS